MSETSATINRQDMIAIIILTYNQRDITLQCLTSITKICQHPIVLWDNGSTDNTVQCVEHDFPQVTVHSHYCNLGVASGRNAAANLAIEQWGATHLLFLDNDMLVAQGFVESLYHPFNLHLQLAQTVGKICFQHETDRINAAGGISINFVLGLITPVGINQRDHGQFDQAHKCLPCGGATMVRSDVFQQLQGLDSIFNPYGPEDLDFSLRVRKKGYYGLYVPEALAFHKNKTPESRRFLQKDYAANKAKHWLILLYRHASISEQFGYFLLGVPATVLRMLSREVTAINLKAVKERLFLALRAIGLSRPK